jgi:hypothetical protein
LAASFGLVHLSRPRGRAFGPCLPQPLRTGPAFPPARARALAPFLGSVLRRRHFRGPELPLATLKWRNALAGLVRRVFRGFACMVFRKYALDRRE